MDAQQGRHAGANLTEDTNSKEAIAWFHKVYLVVR